MGCKIRQRSERLETEQPAALDHVRHGDVVADGRVISSDFRVLVLGCIEANFCK